MIILRRFSLIALLTVYFGVFPIMDKTFQNQSFQLHRALPARLQQVASGYLRQLVSEALFIKTSVFLGGVKPGVPATTYADPLANNFEVMTSLYPEFVDPYYFNQSYLASISKESAQRANSILDTGIKTYPANQFFRFFQAYNFYNYLDQPLKAAEAFQNAAKLPDAPPMFGHLAAIFSAKGGNIAAGLVMLKTMLATEQDKVVIERYQQEIEIYEKALVVDRAISLYTKKYHVPPNKLEDMIPEYLEQIPETQNLFILIYEPPVLPYEHAVLRLKRP